MSLCKSICVTIQVKYSFLRESGRWGVVELQRSSEKKQIKQHATDWCIQKGGKEDEKRLNKEFMCMNSCTGGPLSLASDQGWLERPACQGEGPWEIGLSSKLSNSWFYKELAPFSLLFGSEGQVNQIWAVRAPVARSGAVHIIATASHLVISVVW